MTERHTYWISIGRNVGPDPMSDTRWSQFRSDVHQSAAYFGDIITTVQGESAWHGQTEETYLVLVAVKYDSNVDGLRGVLATIAKQYRQEAIGFVGGPGSTLVES